MLRVLRRSRAAYDEALHAVIVGIVANPGVGKDARYDDQSRCAGKLLSGAVAGHTVTGVCAGNNG